MHMEKLLIHIFLLIAVPSSSSFKKYNMIARFPNQMLIFIFMIAIEGYKGFF